MPRYVVTLGARPDPNPSGDVAQLALQLAADGTHHRDVSVRVSGLAAVDVSDDLWRAVLYYAFEELSVSIKGETWGAAMDEGPRIVLDVTADEAARFVGEPSASIALDAGAVVGEFVS